MKLGMSIEYFHFNPEKNYETKSPFTSTYIIEWDFEKQDVLGTGT
jgi:hypothetical protein